MKRDTHPTRRHLLGHGARLMTVAALPAWGRSAFAAPSAERTLALVHTHTRERIELVYAAAGNYLDDALLKLNRFLRDHYSGDVGVIDPVLYDQLHGVQAALGTARAFEVISGYRAPSTNEMLRSHSSGVAQGSMHLQGKAIDIRLPGSDLLELHKAAVGLKGGGVGLYRSSNFIHVDTGRVRYW